MQDFFFEVIKDKVISHSEIVVILFEECNMSCVFCPQDHSSRVGQNENEILSKIGPISDFINRSKSTDFHIHVMGGELFQDRLIDAGYLQIYDNFMDLLSQKCIGKKLTFRFVTNLVNERPSILKNWVVARNLKLNVSFDFAGRFNKEQLSTFKGNIDFFKDHVNLISVVMTKQNINEFLKGDEYYNYLYENFDISWDHLLPGQNFLKVMMPTESEVFKFYEKCVNEYPRTINVENFFAKKTDQIKMSCTRGNSFTIMADNSTPVGCSGSVLMKDSKSQDLSGIIVIKNFIDQRDCFSCEFYSRCSFSCFVRNEYKDLINDLGDCAFRKIFKIVEEKK